MPLIIAKKSPKKKIFYAMPNVKVTGLLDEGGLPY